jgi:WD40 repeat protein
MEHDNLVESVAFSPDGNYIAVGTASSAGKPQFILLDHTTPGSLSLATTYGITGTVESVYFSPN